MAKIKKQSLLDSIVRISAGWVETDKDVKLLKDSVKDLYSMASRATKVTINEFTTQELMNLKKRVDGALSIIAEFAKIVDTVNMRIDTIQKQTADHAHQITETVLITQADTAPERKYNNTKRKKAALQRKAQKLAEKMVAKGGK